MGPSSRLSRLPTARASRYEGMGTACLQAAQAVQAVQARAVQVVGCAKRWAAGKTGRGTKPGTGSTAGSLEAVHLGPAARLLGSMLQLAALCRQADNTRQTDSYISVRLKRPEAQQIPPGLHCAAAGMRNQRPPLATSPTHLRRRAAPPRSSAPAAAPAPAPPPCR